MILQGDAFVKLKTLESESVDCCITSPPYWKTRDYKEEGQIGQEATVSGYIKRLIAIFDEIRRVLKPTGSCWVVIGDLFQDKSLVGVPERFMLAMLDTWILRSKIIWQKPNVIPSSAKDRFTIDFENILFFTKSEKYYFNTQYEKLVTTKHCNPRFGGNRAKSYGNHTYSGNPWTPEKFGRRIKRSVWRIPTAQFKGGHFAVFPEKLVETPIKSTCPDSGIVLDCFMGAGTTGLVAYKLGRKFIGIELNPDYIKLAEKRLKPYTDQEQITTWAVESHQSSTVCNMHHSSLISTPLEDLQMLPGDPA